MEIDVPPPRRRGPIRRFFGGLLRLVDGTRRLVVNALFLFVVGALLAAWLMRGTPAVAPKTVLVLDPSGPIVEQRAGSARSAALSQITGGAEDQTQLRDVLAALDGAAHDANIGAVFVVLDDLVGGGLATQREVAQGLQRVRAAGKKVIAWGTQFDQRRYYIAAHADEVYLHPQGMVLLEGYGRLRNYYRETFDKLGVTMHLVRAGQFKSAGEPFVASEPSAPTLEADKALYDDLWKRWTGGVEQVRKLPAGAVDAAIARLPDGLREVNGDAAQWALKNRLVDGLEPLDGVRKRLLALGSEDPSSHSFRQVSLHEYAAWQKRPRIDGKVVGVVVAEGEISDGDRPPGSIGGRSTAALVRKARRDDSVGAIVLRVNSPGGSVLGSELVRREFELAREAGKPVLVSMGDLAASGGYWISMAADEVIADPATVTGSIGVFALLPTFEGLMDKAGAHAHGYSTTWIAPAFDPRTPLDPRAQDLLQQSIDHTYQQFTSTVASARKMPREAVDAVAQGRVWTGAQALERKLVDRNGSFADALAAARTRARIDDVQAVRYIEEQPSKLQMLISALQGEMARLRAAFVAAGWLQAVPAAGLSAAPAAMAVGALAGGDGTVRREAQWLLDAVQRRNPWAVTAHCLCDGP